MADADNTRADIVALDCLICGSGFTFPRPKVGRYPRFCSDECRAKRARPRYERGQREMRRFTCSVCGSEAQSYQRAAKYCSRTCKDRRPRKRPSRPGWGHRQSEERTCLNCGRGYRSQRVAEGKRFCSKDCWNGFRAVRSKLLSQSKVSVVAYRSACRECGARFSSATDTAILCSDLCRRRRVRRIAMARYQPVAFRCAECGKHKTTEFGDKSRVYCGSACSRRASRRAAKQARRARKSAGLIEPVSAFKVFARDGWRCHLCGAKTPRKLRGTRDDRAPELDHIIPLAKGGEHSYRNTACACRKCNLEKADRELGQLLLFG